VLLRCGVVCLVSYADRDGYPPKAHSLLNPLHHNHIPKTPNSNGPSSKAPVFSFDGTVSQSPGDSLPPPDLSTWAQFSSGGLPLDSQNKPVYTDSCSFFSFSSS
jgi:hypothetical protein